MRTSMPLVAGLAALFMGLGVAQAADGLNVAPGTPFGERWAARLSITRSTSALAGTAEGGLQRALSARLLGDYYFSTVPRGLQGLQGGLRLTSGVFMGPRGALFGPSAPGLAEPGSLTLGHSRLSATSPDVAPDSVLAWPYLGLGYSAGSLRAGWGFSADLGLAAQNAGALSPNRMFSQSADDLLRDLRLRPVLQLGLSYAF
ncbi:hypothetical protein BurJ1DRAFT_4372 [Burkholderiales bacterium JOSHI_001]|nr:hypothetical protein BurJ1DRAFT_4372 [Burkholderiales bacterium JOSHI_001]